MPDPERQSQAAASLPEQVTVAFSERRTGENRALSGGKCRGDFLAEAAKPAVPIFVGEGTPALILAILAAG
ncbi:hypothetical protein [Sinorhizobium psoraleae]|uniref:Uncharacterized protein n=1 Tax=Sinorhizobium psoraleae TaxID=520838 RepID=A0ABT4KS73_9HYPH|nr:hypothetical protein [Sinorhizobium psoraleae]MCZ4093762.1 hypothetical protein [Sinorhizobium psoraleae]